MKDKPDNHNEPIEQNEKMGFKFSNNIYILKSALDKFNVQYKDEDLEDTLLGKGLIIRRDKND